MASALGMALVKVASDRPHREDTRVETLDKALVCTLVFAMIRGQGQYCCWTNSRMTWAQHEPMWAHMGQYVPIWARMGSARALEEREKFRKTIFLHGTFFSKIVVFDFHIAFFNSFNGFFNFWPKYASERL